jgi:GH25 family lysozyme M1 (1,4-beta-N-acetylmuramidase)
VTDEELAYPVHALDVSNYQKRVDWNKVHAAGYRQAAIKATEGTGYVDPFVSRNVDHARDAGVRFSLYHYAHPSESPRREARHFLTVARELVKVGDPCPCLDLEVTEGLNPHALWRWQHTFSTIVEEAFGGHVILYTYRAFLEADLYLPPRHRPIWGADYGSTPKRVLDGWHAWQYTSDGRVPGVPVPCDLDSILKPLPTIERKR